MEWTDIFDIAIELEQQYPYVDIANISFTKLRQMVISLPGFSGAENGCNEKILEAIQQNWLDERA